MEERMRGRVRRISDELDLTIKNLSIKNNIKYIEASREISKLSSILRNNKNKIYKEIKF